MASSSDCKSKDFRKSTCSVGSSAPSYCSEASPEVIEKGNIHDVKHSHADEKPTIVEEKQEYADAPPTNPPYDDRDPEQALPRPTIEPVYITRHRGVSSFMFYGVAVALLFSVLLNFVYTAIALQGALGVFRSPGDSSRTGLNVAPVINIGDTRQGVAENGQPTITVSKSDADMTTTETRNVTTTQDTTVVTTTTAPGVTSIETTTEETTVIQATVLSTTTIPHSPSTFRTTRTTIIPASQAA